MTFFHRMTIRRKLQTLVYGSTLVLAVMLAIGVFLLNKYGVNGSIYRYIVERKVMMADLAPPVLLVTEPYVILQELETETDKAALERGKQEFRDQLRNYEEKRTFYLEQLIVDSKLKSLIQNDVHQPVEQFRRAATEDYFPNLGGAAAEREKASKVLRDKIKPAYLEHRKAVDLAIKRLRELMDTAEKEGTSASESWLLAMIVLSGASVILILVSGGYISRMIQLQTDKLLGRVTEMANGAGDLTARIPVDSSDELGQLAGGINSMIGKIQTVVTKVRESSVQLLSTAAEINATAKHQELTMAQLGSSTSQIAAAVREISATSSDLSGTMAEVSDRANQTSSLAVSGRSRLGAMETTMQQLVSSTANISTKLTTIREKADNINMVVTTITKVADQTNLLSINAAIEAEKAGEYGRGFLVVAREIRRLADQTAVATLDIENMVQHMHDAVSAGVMQMDQFSEEVRSGVSRVAEINVQTGQIIEEVRGLTDRFKLVNEGMKNQSIGAQQINDAMVNVAGGTKETAASLQEFQKATAHLRSSVETLNQEIARFTV